MLGISAVAGFAIQASMERLTGKVRIVLVAMLCAVIAWWGFAAQRRVEVWQDAVSLWTDAVATATAGTWFASDPNFVTGALAEALARKGNDLEKHNHKEEAITYYFRALRYDAAEQNALYSLASLALADGEIEEAFRYADTLTAKYLHDDRGFALVSVIHFARGEVEKAQENARKALDINPNNLKARKVGDEIRRRAEGRH